MNGWKIVTGAIAIVVLTGFTTGLTTAYLLRPTLAVDTVAPDGSPTTALVPRPAAPAAIAPRATHASRARVVPAVQRTISSEPAGTFERPAPAPRRASVATGSVRPVADTAATDCGTTADHVWRIAKPGLIGTVLGAGVGAAGGAITNGGKGAGKGAALGGLAGAALGSVYGAYKTKQECGSVLGRSNGAGFAGDGTPADGIVSGRGVTRASTDRAPEAAFSGPTSSESASTGGITVYNVK